jgi:hypothetical protein
MTEAIIPKKGIVDEGTGNTILYTVLDNDGLPLSSYSFPRDVTPAQIAQTYLSAAESILARPPNGWPPELTEYVAHLYFQAGMLVPGLEQNMSDTPPR